MNAYLSKPVDPRALAEALRHWLRPGRDSEQGASGATPRESEKRKGRPEKSEAGGARAWDRAGMLSRLMDDLDLMEQVKESFLSDMPRQIQALREGIAEGDRAAVQRHAHTIKGAAGNVGGEALREVARAMEQAAKEDDRGALEGELPRLQEAFERLKEAMEKDGGQ